MLSFSQMLSYYNPVDKTQGFHFTDEKKASADIISQSYTIHSE